MFATESSSSGVCVSLFPSYCHLVVDTHSAASQPKRDENDLCGFSVSSALIYCEAIFGYSNDNNLYFFGLKRSNSQC